MMRKTILKYECCKSMLTVNIFFNEYKTTKTVVCYIETMFIQVVQGIKHPEVGPHHNCTQMYTVVTGSNKGYQTYQRVENP